MKQFNGLLKKEWMSLSGWLYGSIITMLIAVLVIPFTSSFFFKELSTLEISLILSILWATFSIILPTVLLLVSLNNEMVRPDIWLHSTAPMAKLFGIKMLFAAMIGFINIVTPIIIILIQSRLSGFPLEMPFAMTLEMAVGYGFLFLTSVMIMCTGLFLGVLYQLLKPFVKGFSAPIVILFLLFLAWMHIKITETTFYTKIASFGPLNQEYSYDLQKENFFFELAGTEAYTGEVLIDLALAVIFFIAATVVFEKKVRL